MGVRLDRFGDTDKRLDPRQVASDATFCADVSSEDAVY
jgi:hypothetical protein